MEQTITCQQCAGTGYIKHEEKEQGPCDVCDGAGKFDYALIAEYARQIDYCRKLAERRRAVLSAILEHVEDESVNRVHNQCTLCKTYRDAGWSAVNLPWQAK